MAAEGFCTPQPKTCHVWRKSATPSRPVRHRNCRTNPGARARQPNALVASELGELRRASATDWSSGAEYGTTHVRRPRRRDARWLRVPAHELLARIDGTSPLRNSNTFEAFNPKTGDPNRVASRACTSCDPLDSGRWRVVCGRSEMPSRSARHRLGRLIPAIVAAVVADPADAPSLLTAKGFHGRAARDIGIDGGRR